MMQANVINETSSMIGLGMRYKNDASDAFVKCWPQCVDDRFVKIVQGFAVIFGSTKRESLFRLDNIAEDPP